MRNTITPQVKQWIHCCALTLGMVLLSMGAAAQSQAATPKASAAASSNQTCVECHAELVKKVVVHKDCSGCHTNIKNRDAPHSPTGQSAKELAATGVAMCTTCHKPAMFQGKVVHSPIEDGDCMLCHSPHDSPYQGLLKVAPATLCLDCHAEVKKGPHVIAGFSRSGHPLGDDAKSAVDPLRPGKQFYCVSCHEPHRSERPKLNRFPVGMETCLKCHKM